MSESVSNVAIGGKGSALSSSSVHSTTSLPFRAMSESVSNVAIGGKGSALSSSSVHSIAAVRLNPCLDSSALSKLSDQTPPLSKCSLLSEAITLTNLESRASLTVILNNFLHYSSPPSVRKLLPTFIADKLASDGEVGNIEVEVSEEEKSLIERSCAELYGICALVDHEASGLAVVADAVGALSCEALKADDKAFHAVDTGDGYVDKEAVGVASDVRVLLTGYEAVVGKMENDSVSKIPKINGRLRKMVKAIHGMMRVELNSGAKGPRSDGEEAVGSELSRVAVVLWNLGASSLSRAEMNLNVTGNEGWLKDELKKLFETKCVKLEELGDLYKLASGLLVQGEYVKFVHEVYRLLGMVIRIVAWEGITAFFTLEGWDWTIADANPITDVVDKKDKKGKKDNKGSKKKKKTVRGKGNGLLVEFITDTLKRDVEQGSSADNVELLERYVDYLLVCFDPKGLEFHGLVEKVKEIVESNESRRLPKLPKGTRDFANEQMVIRERAFSIITNVFKRHGATALDTPAFELRETLMGKYGEDSKLIYDLADQGGELCSLRYDLTVPFARYVAMNGISSFKRYQVAKVYRRDNPSKGRYREFYQCDFDIAGQYEEMGPDFEIVKVLTELLDELDIGNYEVKLNHRKLLDGMLEICGVPPEKFRTVCSSIDKLDKQSFEQIKTEMVDEKGLAVETADKIGTFVKERGQPKQLLAKLREEGSEFLTNVASKRALDELNILFEALEKSKCIDKVVFDLSLARGLDYYTGVIFEAVFKGATQVGSIAAGGRYDELIGIFGSKKVPAVGVSLGIERVFTIMEQLQKERNETTRPTETQVLLCVMGDATGDKSKLNVAAELVNKLWEAKLRAEYVVAKRSDKFVARAKDSRIPWMIMVGDKELESGVAKMKNRETNVEGEVSLSTLAEDVTKLLSS